MTTATTALLVEKFGPFCWYCGTGAADCALITEHKIPQSRGGSEQVSNLVPACSRCNVKKGSRTMEEFREAIRVATKRRKIEFFGESKQPLDITAIPLTARVARRKECVVSRYDILRLAADTGLDPRTVKRAIDHGLERMHAQVDRVRLRETADKLGIAIE